MSNGAGHGLIDLLIDIEDLSFRYGNGELILEGINLRVRRGDYWVIIGPNGGGKTTLMKIITGLLKPIRGRIEYSKDLFRSGSIGYVSQNPSFNKDFPIKVINVVMMGFLNQSQKYFYKTKQYKEAEENLEFVGLSSDKNKYIHELSGGQLQRVLLARSLIFKPIILLLDESTSFMDSHSRDNLEKVLKDYNHQGMTIILISHDIGVISRNARQIACVNRKLYYHDDPKLDVNIFEQTYGCSIDMITHGDFPHRVLKNHE